MTRKTNGIILSGKVLGLLLLGILVSCQPVKKDQKRLVTITEPVQYGWKDMKEHGVIRMITKYSSSSYFLHRGVERGFEYELMREFAKANNLSLEVVIQSPEANSIDMLNSGEGDVIAGNFTANEFRKQYVQFTRPYNTVNEVVVLSELDHPIPTRIEDIAGLTISVRANSSYYLTLHLLKEQGIDFKIDVVSEEWDTESLLAAVARGEKQATVSDDNLFSAAQTYLDGLVAGPNISEANSVSWAIRKNNPELLTRMNRFLYQHFRLSNDPEKPRRSTMLAVLNNRYFEDFEQISEFRNPVQETQYGGLLSPYDELVRPVAEEVGVDWRLVIAQMAQESRFDPNAKSWAGAVGLMQVIPRFSKFTEKELYDPETNVREGIRILKEHMDHYSYLDSTNRVAYALATYNAGMGHVADARRLAIDANKNPNEWENTSDALLKLMNRKYYKDARYGFCRGIETVRYVNEIQNRYDMYLTILELAAAESASRVRAPSLGFIGGFTLELP